jgi:hypothetical protein
MEPFRHVALRWDVSLMPAAPCGVTFCGIITVAAKSNRWDVMLRHCASGSSVGSKPEAVQVPRIRIPVGDQEQLPAGSVLEPALLETADDTLRELASRSTTPEPDEESWDFDGSMLTSARNGTRRSLMLTHVTSPVSRASVGGMTSRLGHGQSCLPACVPGVSTTPS